MEEQKPKRGCFLSGILWIGAIFSGIGLIRDILVRFAVPSLDPTGVITNMSITFYTYTIINTIVALISYILILCWKKQGCYLMVAISVIGFIADFIFLKVNIYITIGAVIGFTISLLIAYFSYKAIDKREKFIKEEI